MRGLLPNASFTIFALSLKRVIGKIVVLYNNSGGVMKNLLREEIDLLRQNARSVVRELGLLNDAYFEIGVTLAERHLLIELSSCSCPTMGEIAERLLLDKSTASRLIAKAVKKGYIKCSSDKADKRKRFLHLTDLGKKTLTAFEPIAFRQTENALSFLTTEEIDLVYQGVALYAKGLKNSRLQNCMSLQPNTHIEKHALGTEILTIESYKQLAVLGFTLKPFSQEDEDCLYTIFREVVDAGGQFHYESNSMQEFYRQFLNPQSRIYVCHSPSKEVVGGFYIRSNFPGRANHIANAAYMVKSTYQGQGIGTLLVKASIEKAKILGFRAMQFNMVLRENVKAVKLYQKLGFTIIGTIPEAIRNSNGSYQDGYILHRKLDM
jgi:DNA-binding MarR family transcriptional regulator/L-amino acid N-acyltransferase YncA